MSKRERIKCIEQALIPKERVKVIVMGCDEHEPLYDGRKFVVYLSHTKAELEVMKSKKNL